MSQAKSSERVQRLRSRSESAMSRQVNGTIRVKGKVRYDMIQYVCELRRREFY